MLVGFNTSFDISIHSPDKGRDFTLDDFNYVVIEFQSTLPTRGETSYEFLVAHLHHYFNPLSRQGERHCKISTYSLYSDFNPLSRQGERQSKQLIDKALKDFNPLSRQGERRYAVED